MGLAALRQALKDDFVRVEYIENTSTAYIDTHIIPDTETGLKVKVLYTETSDKYFVGLRQGTNGRWCIGNNTNNYYWGYGSKYQLPSEVVLPNVFAEIYMNYKNNKSYKGINIETKDEYTDTLPTLGFTPTVSIRVFGANAWTGSLNSKCRIYSLQITQGSEIIRDFIPMYQISTDTYGLWDRVTEEFYTSPNGVKFTGGERVIADANENLYYLKNYVNVSNNQRKDLGFQPVGNDSWEGKFYFIGTGRQDILGAWNAQGQKQYGFMGIENRQMRFLYNTQTVYNTLSYGNKTFTLKADKNKFYIYDANNKLIWSNSATYTSGNNPVRNFILGHLNGSVYASNARMYYFKYMRGDNLVWDLIPVQRCSDKVWGLFCKVHNSFYESSGGTAFTGG